MGPGTSKDFSPRGRAAVARAAALALVAVAVAAAVALPVALAGCASGGGSELMRFFSATWRASVDVSGNAVYGVAAGEEGMFDLVLSEDGAARVVPLDDHADLLSEEATWSMDSESALVLHLAAGDVELAVVDDATLEGPAAPFGIEDFETVTLRYWQAP